MTGWKCKACGDELDVGASFCAACGARWAEDAAALAHYEQLLAEFASDGVLEDWEEEELRLVRHETGITDETHARLAARHQPLKEALPVSLEVDATTMLGFVAGARAVLRLRVTNGGARALRNVLVRFVAPGLAPLGEHTARLLRPGGDEAFMAPLAPSNSGQFALSAALKVEDTLGKASFYRAAPLPCQVGERAGAGPQMAVMNIDASAMRVGDLSGLKVGGPSSGSQGGVVTETRWVSLVLRPISVDDWSAWEAEHDPARAAQAAEKAAAEKAAAEKAAAEKAAAERAAAERAAAVKAAAERLAVEKAAALEARAKAEAEARAKAEAEARARAEAEARAKAEAKARAEAEERAAKERRARAEAEERAAKERRAREEAAQREAAKAQLETQRTGVMLFPAVSFRRGAEAQVPRDWQGPASGYAMKRIEPQMFWMGAEGFEANADEKPRHPVTITRAYWIGTLPVYQSIWDWVRGLPPTFGAGAGTTPVTDLSWLDACQLANDLSLRDGLRPAYQINYTQVSWDRSSDGYRLPTEAEWECAARAGSDLSFAGSNTLADVGWYSGNSGGRKNPVGQKSPNAWGLYDLSGNVFEWCWDWEGPYPTGPVDAPSGPPTGARRIYRGGAWNYSDWNARVTYRLSGEPTLVAGFVGLRLARFA